jgi:hypothetical protein
MTTWTSDELDKIGRVEELRIAPLRRDGTLRNPVTVWVVRHGDDQGPPSLSRTAHVTQAAHLLRLELICGPPVSCTCAPPGHKPRPGAS